MVLEKDTTRPRTRPTIMPPNVSARPVPKPTTPVMMPQNSGTAVASSTANMIPVRVTTSSSVMARSRTGAAMPYCDSSDSADGVATSKVAYPLLRVNASFRENAGLLLRMISLQCGPR